MSFLLTAMIAFNTVFTGCIPMPALAEVTPVQSENPDTGNPAAPAIMTVLAAAAGAVILSKKNK